MRTLTHSHTRSAVSVVRRSTSVIVRLSRSPGCRLLKWTDVCVLAQKKCSVVTVYGHVQKGFNLMVMLSMDPCIETDRLSLWKMVLGTVKVLS